MLVRRQWVTPLMTLGFVDTRKMILVDLFPDYTEEKASPFAVFHAELKPRSGGGSTPAVTSAELHVELHLGWIRSALYLVSPTFLHCFERVIASPPSEFLNLVRP